MGEENIDEFFCPNEACPDYGKKGKGNIRLKEHYGKPDTALLRCKTCKKTFSENRGTPFFGLHTPKETVCEKVTEYLLRDLNLSQVQVDEIWTFIKKRTNI
jgi:transposase-like protein